MMQENIRSVANDISTQGGTAVAYTVDVTSAEQVQEAANRVQHDLGDVTILVNNAMANCTDDILRIDLKQAKKVMEVNVLAQLLVSIADRNCIFMHYISKNHPLTTHYNRQDRQTTQKSKQKIKLKPIKLI